MKVAPQKKEEPTFYQPHLFLGKHHQTSKHHQTVVRMPHGPSIGETRFFVASLDQMQLIIPKLSPATLEFGIHLDTDLQSVENCPLLVRPGQVTERVVGWLVRWLVGWLADQKNKRA